MLVKNLLSEIGFTNDEQKSFYEYKNIIGRKTDNYAEAFMHRNISFNEALAEVRKFQSRKLHQYTIDLLFILDCTGYLLEKYEADGISKNIFIDSMKDIKYKLEECIRVKNIFGTFVAEWFEGFFCLKRFALGRLQYDVQTYDGSAITINDYTIHKGDFILNCHIPSSGPLASELCMESFKTAYKFFKDKLSNDILPIGCDSWLLYPPYRKVFGEKSNISDFASNFEIVKVKNAEKFYDMWRVFGAKAEDGDINNLPANTSMQRNFIDYIKEWPSFGTAEGIILFDGEKVLTRNSNK